MTVAAMRPTASTAAGGDPLATLRGLYADPLRAAQDYLRAGGKVIGIVGHVAPVE